MKTNLYQEIARRGVITEREIITLKSRLNRGKTEVLDIFKNGYLNITPEQSEKGLNWLLNQWKTPRGKERKNNPFGYREQEIIEDFERFELVDLIDNGNAYFSAFLPVYRVIDRAGNHFDYFVNLGFCKIID